MKFLEKRTSILTSLDRGYSLVSTSGQPFSHILKPVTPGMIRRLRVRYCGKLLCGLVALTVAAVAPGCLRTDNQASLEVRVTELTAEKEYLSEELKNLQTENTKLAQELAKAKRELADLSIHTDKVRQLNSALQQDTQTLRDAFEKLKTEHEKLFIENTQLKKELAERSRTTTLASRVGPRKNQVTREDKTPTPKEHVPTTPCDAIVQLVQRCESVVRNYRGDEQRQRLRTLRAQFSEFMKNAPADVTEALNAWLTDLSRLSSDPLDAAMFPLVMRKNAILKACVKTD